MKLLPLQLHSLRIGSPFLVESAVHGLSCANVYFGDTPAAGHYITVAQHEIAGGTWWLYDDGRRILADASLVVGVGAYRDCDNMKTYCLFYERT